MNFETKGQKGFCEGLYADLTKVYRLLLAPASTSLEESVVENSKIEQTEEHWLSSNLGYLQQYFDLSFFECQVLLLCVGAEIDSRFPALCLQLQKEGKINYLTPELLVNRLPEGNWQAFSPQGPLRYWRLLECHNDSSFRLNKLTVSERILDFFLEVEGIGTLLRAILRPLQLDLPLVASHKELAKQIVQFWEIFDEEDIAPCNIHLIGFDVLSLQQVALQACQYCKIPLYRLETQAIPYNNSHELAGLLLLLRREAILSGCIYLVEYEVQAEQKAAFCSALSQLVEYLPNHLILAGKEVPPWLNQPVIEIKVQRPTSAEQLALWQQQLPQSLTHDNSSLEQLVGHFDLNVAQLTHIAVRCYMEEEALFSDEQKQKTLWHYCRTQTRQMVEGLVQIIEPKAGWDDLILPEIQLELLHNLMFQVLHRYQVYQHWGFARKYSRGLGICALFAGPSGTGKTLAAEVLAKELHLDLYHIDLSYVINKYVGETEKQLKKVFDRAETSGALLLFDEADALFGKRSEVKDGRDRYANLEVSYLLQRMESYRGLSILTTNLREALDEAFMRRIRFIVNFSFPDHAQRLRIWQKVFPATVPQENLDFSKLASLNLAGGPIRNIAMNAAFIAAEMKQPVTMRHLLRAAHMEYLKLNRPLLKKEIENWI